MTPSRRRLWIRTSGRHRPPRRGQTTGAVSDVPAPRTGIFTNLRFKPLTDHTSRAQCSTQHEPAPSLDRRAVPCGSRSGPRWHCAWTKQGGEDTALRNLVAQDFEAYLPLLLVRLAWREAIVPCFPRYCFVRFDPDHDAWGAIASTRGVCGLIQHGLGQPTPLPDHAIAALLARTSARGLVDDPADAAQDAPRAGQRPVWQDMTGMDAGARVRLLVRLFGASATRRALENIA
jgi:hypothetical protein